MKDRHDNELDDRKFMVAIWAAGGQGPSTTFVMLDLEGNVVDMLYCGQLSGNIVKLRDYSPREREEQQATRKFDERFLYQRHIEDDPRKVYCSKSLHELSPQSMLSWSLSHPRCVQLPLRESFVVLVFFTFFLGGMSSWHHLAYPFAAILICKSFRQHSLATPISPLSSFKRLGSGGVWNQGGLGPHVFRHHVWGLCEGLAVGQRGLVIVPEFAPQSS